MSPSLRSTDTISLPVYRRIEQDIRSKIRDGVWIVGAMIPSRRELARQYQVEVKTIQRAIGLLLDDGVLRAEAGRGTFVAIGPSAQTTLQERSLRIGISLRDAGAISNADSYVAHIVNGIRRALAPHGLRHSIAFVGEQDLDTILDVPRSELSGLLFVSPDIDRRTYIDHVWRSGIPLVVVGSSWIGLDAPFVDCDNFAGTNAALSLLAAQGHTDIACAVVNANACHHYDRGQAFRIGMAERGLVVHPEHIIERWKPTPEQGVEDLRGLLRSPSRPTALLAVDPSIALRALHVARELGIRVPDDLSIVTFDDTLGVEHSQPPLTTVAAPFEEMGCAGMNLLIDLCHGKPVDHSPELLSMRVIERASIGPASLANRYIESLACK